MVRPVTIQMGILIFGGISVVTLSLTTFEQSRLTNEELEKSHKDVAYFQRRVKLYAIPVDENGEKVYDSLEFLTWHRIKLKLTDKRLEIENLEKRPLRLEVAPIILTLLAIIGLMCYAPALWVHELRFSNEGQKIIFHCTFQFCILTAFFLRLYSHFGVVKKNYPIVTEIARKAMEEVGGIRFPIAIHFCYHGLAPKTNYVEFSNDWRYLSINSSRDLELIAMTSGICHSELLTILTIVGYIFCVTAHLVLFLITTRLGRSMLRLLVDMDRVENVDYIGEVEHDWDLTDKELMGGRDEPEGQILYVRNKPREIRERRKREQQEMDNNKSAAQHDANRIQNDLSWVTDKRKRNEKLPPEFVGDNRGTDVLLDDSQLRELEQMYTTSAVPNHHVAIPLRKTEGSPPNPK